MRGTNIPNTPGFAPGTFDKYDGYDPMFFCGNDCGNMVDNNGQWCDHCEVSNAQMCGDWTEEAIAAAVRLKVEHPQTPNA